MSRIKTIARNTAKPIIKSGSVFEVDELKTYIKSKRRECWVIYALDKLTGLVVDIKLGRRTTENIKRVTDTLLLANCNQICADGLRIYRQIIPLSIHSTRRYGTNHIERKNLSLRTQLRRLHRKTICYSKSMTMLEACLKIYFWT